MYYLALAKGMDPTATDAAISNNTVNLDACTCSVTLEPNKQSGQNVKPQVPPYDRW